MMRNQKKVGRGLLTSSIDYQKNLLNDVSDGTTITLIDLTATKASITLNVWT